MNYYNEFDKNAAEWLRELISEKLIPEGDVDERSIENVSADDIRGYKQCHFFAGIGGWSLALQLARWPEDKPVWTGSCPCQPFSVAGKQLGTSDDRDLWPAFFRLIEKCQPEFIFGEQVANAVRHNWLDRICADMEGENYAVGSVVLGAHSVGSPHKRQRLYWGAIRMAENPDGWGCGRWTYGNQTRDDWETQTERLGNGISMANNEGERFKKEGEHCHRSEERASLMREFISLADSNEPGLERRESVECARQIPFGENRLESLSPWRSSAFILCRDWKARRVPTESLLFGMADGLPEGVDVRRVTGISESGGFPITTQKEGRAMLLKGYGNAIVPQVAAEFVQAFL